MFGDGLLEVAAVTLLGLDTEGAAGEVVQALSAKYKLRHLCRELREEGTTPPDLPHALNDFDPPEPETDPTPEERL